MKKRYVKGGLIVLVEVLSFYYLPSASWLQLATSLAILMLAAMGIHRIGFSKRPFRLADAAICLFCLLLLLCYLTWENLLNSLTNILLVVCVIGGLYDYLATKNSS